MSAGNWAAAEVELLKKRVEKLEKIIEKLVPERSN